MKRILALTLVTAACRAPEPAPPTAPRSSPASVAAPRLASAAQLASFQTFTRELSAQAAAEDRTVITASDGFLFLASELRHASLGPFWGEAAGATGRADRVEHRDPLPAILDLHEQLIAMGIELLFVPVPAKLTIYPQLVDSSLGSPPPRIDQADRSFLDLLEARGVAVLDLTPVFLRARATDDEPLYCRTDSHWSPRAIELAAAAIAERIRSLELGNPTNLELATQLGTISIHGDLATALPDAERPAAEQLSLRRVGLLHGARLTSLQPDPDSPVLLLGDSHNLVFSAGGDLHGRGAGLPDHLARELAMSIDVVAVRGSGATPSRVNLRRRGGISSKKVVVWCLSVREYTEGSGWQLVPLTSSATHG